MHDAAQEADAQTEAESRRARGARGTGRYAGETYATHGKKFGSEIGSREGALAAQKRVFRVGGGGVLRCLLAPSRVRSREACASVARRAGA